MNVFLSSVEVVRSLGVALRDDLRTPAYEIVCNIAVYRVLLFTYSDLSVCILAGIVWDLQLYLDRRSSHRRH